MGVQQNLSIDAVRRYNFIHPLPLDPLSDTAALLHDICQSGAFKRLNSIRFLGGIDYALVRSPNGAINNVRYTRAQHSLGVAMLAWHYIKKVRAADDDARSIFTAALLHDIGHAPLSHSLEPVFEREFNLSHHRATESIIRGDIPLGTDLHVALRNHGIDIERIISLISGRDKGFHEFFSGPINFDTLEGISRSQMYARAPSHFANPSAIVDAAVERISDRDRDIVDGFWNQKNEAYRYVIGSRTGILADFACQLFMREHLRKFTKDDYFTTEEAAFKKLPGLHQLLTSRSFELDVWRLITEPITYTARSFYIDEGADFFGRDDVGRYKQAKQLRALEALHSENSHIATMRDLFDDHTISAS